MKEKIKKILDKSSGVMMIFDEIVLRGISSEANPELIKTLHKNCGVCKKSAANVLYKYCTFCPDKDGNRKAFVHQSFIEKIAEKLS